MYKVCNNVLIFKSAEKTTNPDPETDPPIFKSVLIRGDLDFVEQLWVLMRKSKFVLLVWTLPIYLSISN